jgi:hypothetical protein
MIESILLLGLEFWAITLVAFIILMALVENKYTVPSLLVVSLYVILTNFCFNHGWTPVNIVGYVKTHPSDIAVGAIVYFLIGTIWSFIKWWSFVKHERRRYDEVFNSFIEDHADLKDVPQSKWSEDAKRQLASAIASKSSYDNQIRVRPQVENFKEEILLWIGFWPFSAAWTIIDDPIRRICTGIYNVIGKRLQAISDSAWKGTEPK